MSDEMEIMREYKDTVKQKDPNDEQEIYGIIGRVHCWLEPAVKLEVLRQIKIMQGMGIMFQPVERFEEYTRTLQVAPQYCEGMQEAIKTGAIRYKKGNFVVGDSCEFSGLYFDYSGYEQILNRCPFCEEGKNCIGENND